MTRTQICPALLACLAGSAATAQPAGQDVRRFDPPSPPALQSREVPYFFDSGPVGHDDAPTPAGDGRQIVAGTVVHVPDAPWMRLRFDTAELAGDPAADGAIIRLTSLRDGAVQVFNAESLAQWHGTSAYFNGDLVALEIIASPRTPAFPGSSRVVITSVTVGEGSFNDRSICGATDDRVLSSDNRAARHMPIGCTSWVINDTNSMFLTAGHCATGTGDVMQFNVPLSTSSGATVNPPPQDQYSVEGTSAQQNDGGVGNDWGYFGVLPNSNTGLTPFQAYGVRYTLAPSAPSVSGQTIRITGYGTTSSPVSPTWNQVQKTHTGAYRSRSGTALGYSVDTTGGNSGSAVFNETDGTAIGIHTHGGCTTSSSSWNSGTAINLAGLQNALNNPLGICRTGRGSAGGRVYVYGDSANNFGTASTTTGVFARMSAPTATPQGLTFEPFLGMFYGLDHFKRLYTINPATGAGALVGTVTGTAAALNALAFDPTTRTLYTIAQATGQLYVINTATLVASPTGAAAGGTIGALEIGPGPAYDLYALDDAGGTRLVTLNPATGARMLIGALGAGATDCNGLALNPDDGQFYTINAANEQLLRVNPGTGAATLVGSTGGLFGSSFGMAGLIDAPPACPADFNHDGFLSADDFDQYVAAFESGDPAADFNDDGFLSGDDFDGFVLAFEAGC